MQRYFTTKKNEKMILEDGDFHHIKDVMRIKSGEQIICVCENKTFLCNIIYDNKEYEINIIKEINNKTELKKKVVLYQALIRNENLDLVIQKACELGATDFYPTIFNRNVVKITDDKKENKLNRFRKIAKEAAEQSHRESLMEIHDFIDVNDIKKDKDELALLAYENNNDVYILEKSLNNINDYNKISIVIGPEGGIDNSEVNNLMNKGFINVSLGKRILRSETAAMFSLSLISFYLEGKKYE